MGCGTTSGECTENGDGLRIRLYDVRDSGYGNTLRRNRFEKTGYNAVDVFGPNTTIENNVITKACYSKADCGGVRTFGETSLAATTVYNVRLVGNVIADVPGNVDGCHPSRAAFGMGLYVDNYSRDVEVRGNTVVDTTIAGILLQRSTGQVFDNTVFNAATGTEYSAAIELGGDETRAAVTGNVQYALNNEAWTLYARALANFTSADNNYLFHPYVQSHIAYGPSWTRYTFTGWQTFSGREAHSKTNWFTQAAGEASRGTIFFNATASPVTVDVGGRSLVDLDQNPAGASLALPPFSSKVLVDTATTMRVLSVSRVGEGVGSVTSLPAGIDCGLDCRETLPQGTSVTLTATPIGTSSFAGWSGACSGVGPCVVDLSSDAAVTARFDPDEGVTIEDVSVVEGDNGTKTVTNKVRLSAPSTQPVTIDWSTADPAPTP
jgi:parallel beta-helix repeat protein